MEKIGHGRIALIDAGFTREGHTKIVKLLIDNGADVDAQPKYGDTALVDAIYEGHTEIVKLLVDKGADVNVKNKFGYTALLETCGQPGVKSETVRQLIDIGADVNAKDENGRIAAV